MRPKNFPERRRQRQIRALARLPETARPEEALALHRAIGRGDQSGHKSQDLRKTPKKRRVGA